MIKRNMSNNQIKIKNNVAFQKYAQFHSISKMTIMLCVVFILLFGIKNPVLSQINNSDGNQVVTDTSIGQYNGVLGSSSNIESSDPKLVNGWSGKALDFDGQDDYVTIPDSDCSALDISGGKVTISAWVNPDSQSENDEIRSIAGKGNTQYMLAQSNNGWEFSVYDGETSLKITSNDQPSIGEWTHLVGRYDPESDDVSLWVNGKKQGGNNITGGAEPGVFWNLKTPVANLPVEEIVSVEDYGAVPDDGQDDTDAIQQALNSGENVKFPNGVYNISQDLKLSDKEMATKTIFAESDQEVIIRASNFKAIKCHYFYNIQGFIFEKIGLHVYGGENKNHTRFIQGNKFEQVHQDEAKFADKSIYIPQNEKVENLVIKNNSIYGGLFAILVGNECSAMLNNSYIEDNYTEGCRRHIIFKSGGVNVKIRNNELRGEDTYIRGSDRTERDMVGIGFFQFEPHSPVRGNIIENNSLYDISEEGISFDGFGNRTNNYSRWTGNVINWDSSDGQVTRLYLNSTPTTSDWDGGSGFENYSLVFFQDGASIKGKSALITGGGVNNGDAYVDIKGGIDESKMSYYTDYVIFAQLPKNILLRNNHCERIGRTGINHNLGTFNFYIENNTLISCSMSKATHPTHKKRWGGISYRSVSGMGGSPGDHSPAFYGSIIKNNFSGYYTDLSIYEHNWGDHVFNLFGVDRCGNTFSNGAKIVEEDLEDCPPMSNSSNVAIGYDPVSVNGFFDGKIDDVRIYRRALADSEISGLADGDSIGNEFLFGYWKFDNLLQTVPSSVKKKVTDNKIVSIYPNPASTKIMLKFNFNDKSAKLIEIINMQGKKIKSFELDNSGFTSTYQLDVSNMRPGLYLLQVKAKQTKLTRIFQVVQ